MYRKLLIGLLAIGAAGVMAASAPSLVVYKGAEKRTYNLSDISSISFAKGVGVKKAQAIKPGFQFRSRAGNGAVFTLQGAPGTMASLRIVDLSGRIVWSGTAQLDASGFGSMNAPAIHTRSMLIARYDNGSSNLTQALPMMNGGMQ